MKLSIYQQIFVQNIARLILFANSKGINMTFGEAYRTDYQQAEHVRNKKSHTMNSNHLRRLAIDFNFFINGELTYDKEKLKEVGSYWVKIDKLNRWGGDFKNVDTPHFEMNV